MTLSWRKRVCMWRCWTIRAARQTLRPMPLTLTTSITLPTALAGKRHASSMTCQHANVKTLITGDLKDLNLNALAVRDLLFEGRAGPVPWTRMCRCLKVKEHALSQFDMLGGQLQEF